MRAFLATLAVAVLVAAFSVSHSRPVQSGDVASAQPGIDVRALTLKANLGQTPGYDAF